MINTMHTKELQMKIVGATVYLLEYHKVKTIPTPNYHKDAYCLWAYKTA